MPKIREGELTILIILNKFIRVTTRFFNVRMSVETKWGKREFLRRYSRQTVEIFGEVNLRNLNLLYQVVNQMP